MIRWLCGHISPTAPSRRYSRCGDRPVVRPDGNNVGGPSHAMVHGRDCTTASRSNSPNYKIIILRLAPPGNTRDQTRSSPLSSLGLIRHILRAFTSAPLPPYSSFPSPRHAVLVPSLLPMPSSSYLSGSRRSSLIVRQDEDVRALTSWCARTHHFKRIAQSVPFNLAFSPKEIMRILILSMPKLFVSFFLMLSKLLIINAWKTVHF